MGFYVTYNFEIYDTEKLTGSENALKVARK